MTAIPPTDSLSIPPFPPLKWDEFFWTGEDRFPEWESFQDRTGAYGALNSTGQPPRPASVHIQPANRALKTPPSVEQSSAYEYLKSNGAAVVAAILDALLAAYPKLRESYRDAIDDYEEVMPEVSDPNDFRRLIGLGTVHVQNVARDALAYIGFEIGCTWDDEHGVGVVTHKDRVIEVGGASESFSMWPGKRDGGKELE